MRRPSDPPPALDAAALRGWARDGWLVLPGWLSPADCAAMRARAEALIEALLPEALSAGATFSTRDDDPRGRYFLGSADRSRLFLEEGALGPDGALQVPADRAANKIGHALHALDPVLSRLPDRERLGALARVLGQRAPTLIQSMLICKPPGTGARVDVHRDHTFLWTDPPSVLGFWFALADAAVENGCLWALPGRHRDPPRRRFVRRTAGRLTELEFEVFDERPWDLTDAVPLEVPAGSLVVLHGLTPHFSRANRSTASRPAYALHAVEGAAAWPAENWLQGGCAVAI